MSSRGAHPIRILHIVGGMSRGGIETWLMHILRSRDAARFRMDFIVHTTEPCPYDDELRSLGSRIFSCRHTGRPWEYARDFQPILAARGPFDIVHSHVHQFSGVTLRAARRSHVPVRIAHSHTDTTLVDAAAGLARRLYVRVMRRLIWKNSTHGLAASKQSASSLFGLRWSDDPRFRVLFYGIDLAPFRASPDASVRAEFGLPADAFVVGHIGRFEEQKNHAFLLDIARALAAIEPRTRLLLIGTGSLRPAMERRAAALGIADRVIFAGLRSDIARVLRGAVDVFALPSINEGLPLVLIEAQAAGLPCVFTDSLSEETSIIPELTTRIPLSEPATTWTARILAAGKSARGVSPHQALAAIAASPFDIRQSAEALMKVYSAAMARHP
jgi:glycosyltransferase involved in cell wall biosynthesis